MRPGVFDYGLVALLVLRETVEGRWLWPSALRAIRTGVTGARTRMYRNTIVFLWIVTLYVLALWIVQGRPWSALWLGSAVSWRLSIGISAAAIVIAFLMLQARRVQKALARPKAVARLREQLAFADPLAPKTSGERRGFWLLSITAGICEEILFRGFLIWFIAAWTGLAAGIVLSSIVFGFAHIYLGAAHVPKTAVVGFALAVIVVASGSLWPAMVIHTALDLNGGELGFRVSRAAATDLSSATSVTS